VAFEFYAREMQLMRISVISVINCRPAIDSWAMETYFQEKNMRIGMKHISLVLGMLGLGVALAVPSSLAAKDQTYTGTVSDAMCGKKHMMEGDAAACLRACVAKGSKYALVVGDKVYTLDTSDKGALAMLDKLADQQASVKGTANGDTITVSSVKAAQ